MKFTAYIKDWGAFEHIGISTVRSVQFELTNDQAARLKKRMTGTFLKTTYEPNITTELEPVFEEYSHHFLVTDDGQPFLVVIMANHQRMIDFQEPLTYRYIKIEFTEDQQKALSLNKYKHEDYFCTNIEGIERGEE